MRVAVVAGPDPGHAFPSLALAAALSRRGHDVAMATGEQWRPHIEGEGATWVGIPFNDADPRDEDFGFRLWGRGAQMAPRLADALAVHRPDVVVTDVLTIPGWFAADLLGLPRIEVVPHLLQVPSRALPPPGTPIRPGRSGWGRTRDALLRRLTARSLAQAAIQRRDARASIGLPAGSAPVARLVATLPGLEWPRPDWPERTYLVGPLVWEPSGDVIPVPAGDGPLVLASDSTASTPGRGGIIDTALAALPPAGFRVVGTRFGAYDGVLPEGAVVAGGAQDPVIEQAAAVLAPGGHGLLVKALRRGVPVVLVPGPGDQAANAVRVEMLGCGLQVAPDKMSPQTVLAAVREVTSNARYRRAAEAVARSGRGLGPDHAARVVEEVVADL